MSNYEISAVILSIQHWLPDDDVKHQTVWRTKHVI